MNLRMVAVAMVAMMLGAVAAHAAPRQSFGVNGGISTTTGGADADGTGSQFGGTYDCKILPDVGLGVAVNFLKFGNKSSHWSPGDVVDLEEKDAFNLVRGDLHIKYFPLRNSTVQPYLEIGAGAYDVSDITTLTSTPTGTNPSTDVATLTATTTVTRFGSEVGAGASVAAGSVTRIGVEALYHTILYQGGAMHVFTAGLTLSFMFGK